MPSRLSRKDFIKAGVTAAGAGLLGAPLATTANAAQPEDNNQMANNSMNVLFIAVDDLRPQLSCFGHDHMISPNIDALASRGTAFLRTQCQQAVCAPSRASLLTGLRPDSTEIYDLHTPVRSVLPDVVTLPLHFKNNGYRTISLGKIYHHGNDDRKGWSEKPWHAPHSFPGHASEKLRRKKKHTRKQAREDGHRWRWRGPSTEGADEPDEKYADRKIADRGIKALRDLQDENFFLACGFMKPHLAFAAPKKYWDLYDRNEIPMADTPFRPENCPDIALHNWGELRAYSDIPKKGRLTDEKARELVHGYYACTSFIDAQIGRLLDELDRLGLADNTVVALWGDHGWNLREHGLWCKHCNFETSTHSPLVVSAPDQNATGQPTDALCEFVDIYPTLCDLCDLPLPDHLEGTSLTPLINDPDIEWKRAAFSQYPRGKNMGYSMRTDRYRYTEWQKPNGDVIARELYDHENDPGENVNIAGDAENAELVERLGQWLDDGWQSAQPPQ